MPSKDDRQYPKGHVGLRRMIKHVASLPPLVKNVIEPEKYLNSSRTNKNVK